MPSNPDDEPDFYTMPPLSYDANESSSDKNTESTTANIPSAPIVSRDSSTYSLTNPTRNATSCVLPQACSPSSDPYIQSQLQQTIEGKSDETEQIEDFGNIPFYPLKENESRRHSFLPHLARRLSRRLSSMGIDIPTFIASGDTNDEDMSMNVTARNSRRISRRLSSMGIDLPTFFSYGNENDGMNEEALVSPSIASNGEVSRQGSIILDPSADGTFAQEMEWMSRHLQNDDLSDEMLTRILERIIS
jgi:Fe2+ transport system protein FeoA